MRPHSSRPLQYEDGVGGSQRGAPSSGTNTGNRRAGKRRHGKTPEVSRNTREQSRFAAVVRSACRVGGQKRAAHLTDSGSWSNSGGQRDAVWRKTRGFVIVWGGFMTRSSSGGALTAAEMRVPPELGSALQAHKPPLILVAHNSQ